MGRPSHRGIHMPVASTLPRRACLALLLAFSCGTVSAASPAPAAAEAAAVPPQLQDLDAYVERVREQFDVPGIAVAIVKDGKVVLERGYGVRELGKPAEVDAHAVRHRLQHQGLHRRLDIDP